MNVLVFDINVVSAKMLAESLSRYLRNVSIEFAHNPWVLRDRLREKKYNLVIADTDAVTEAEEVVSTLRDLPDTTRVYIVSAMDRDKWENLRQRCGAANVLQKPGSFFELRNVVAELATQ